MNKNYIFNILMAALGLAVALLWMVSMFNGGSNFSIYWAVVIVGFVSGALFIVRGVMSKKLGPLKTLDILLGAVLIISAILALIQIYAKLNKYTMPIIAVAVAAAVLLIFVATGKNKWDKGDNQSPDYKNYYQRKAEEEKLKNEKKDNDN